VVSDQLTVPEEMYVAMAVRTTTKLQRRYFDYC